jgi:hypothetical protein
MVAQHPGNISGEATTYPGNIFNEAMRQTPKVAVLRIALASHWLNPVALLGSSYQRRRIGRLICECEVKWSAVKCTDTCGLAQVLLKNTKLHRHTNEVRKRPSAHLAHHVTAVNLYCNDRDR